MNILYFKNMLPHPSPRPTESGGNSYTDCRSSQVWCAAMSEWFIVKSSSSHSQFCYGVFFCCSDISHVSVDTFQPSLLWPSSSPPPGWYHLQSLSSDVVFVLPLRVQTTSLASLHLSVIFSTFSLSLMLSLFPTCYLLHLHIFISVISSLL